MDDQIWADLEKLIEPAQPNFSLGNATSKENHANALKEGLQRWHKAFESLLHKLREGGGDGYLVVTALSLRYTCSKITLKCCFGHDFVYDDWICDFKPLFNWQKSS